MGLNTKKCTIYEMKVYKLTTEDNKLTINKEYLSTLDKVKYTLKLNYSNDEYLTTTFTIPSGIINNPSIYDGINTYIIIDLLSSIIGLIIYQKITKKS